MKITFYEMPANAVTGSIVIDDATGEAHSIEGDAHRYLNNWKRTGRSVEDFASFYNSWTNGHVRSESEVATLEPTLAFTIDDDGKVLELILSNTDGVHVRENGKWSLVDVAKDQPTIDNLEWLDATEDAIKFWDDSADTDDLTRDDVEKYAAPSE